MTFFKSLMNPVVDTKLPIGYNIDMTDEQLDKMTFRLRKSVAKKFRIKVIENDDTIQRICEDAVDKYLKNK